MCVRSFLHTVLYMVLLSTYIYNGLDTFPPLRLPCLLHTQSIIAITLPLICAVPMRMYPYPALCGGGRHILISIGMEVPSQRLRPKER